MDKYAGATWRKSSRSGGNDNCVEFAVAADGTGVGLRDSKAGPDGAIIDLDPAGYRAFIDGVKSGDFDLPT